jgi:UrcA family protein
MNIRVVVFAALGCFALGSALADDRLEDTPSVVVEYGDLNLESDRGARTLYVRIVSAAKQVCPQYRERSLSIKTRAFACQRQAIERAVREINHPRLVAIHSSRGTV